QNGQRQTGDKEANGQHRGGARQGIGLAARRHEATSATADAERTTFRALEEHNGDEREHDHQMKDEKSRLHVTSGCVCRVLYTTRCRVATRHVRLCQAYTPAM